MPRNHTTQQTSEEIHWGREGAKRSASAGDGKREGAGYDGMSFTEGVERARKENTNLSHWLLVQDR